jgi:hypothetical protein
MVRIDEDYDAIDEAPLFPPVPEPVADPRPLGEMRPEPGADVPREPMVEARPELVADVRPQPEAPGAAFGPMFPEPAAPSGLGPEQYPIPPVFAADEPADAAPPPVPTWAFRAPVAGAQPPGAVGFVGDLTLDPMSLRRRVTIRSGASALTVDDTKIVLRSWWKRSELAWSEITGFEPRLEGENGGGRLVAVTPGGPRELPATRRSLADLRYLAALLDAYRQRALIMSNSH